MSIETIERCDCCGEDVRSLSFAGGTSVYRKQVKRGGWFWKGKEEKPGESWETVCSDCWQAIGRAVRDAREKSGVPE